MPDLLVVYATRMGATREIADAIAGECHQAGLAVTVVAAGDLPDPADYRAVVLGSGLYLGRWHRHAVRYARRYALPLRDRRVWLFQDGPCGAGHSPADTRVPRRVRRLAERLETDLPVTFGGRLDPARADGPLARWLANSSELRGDFRDWSTIRRWARDIAQDLAVGASDGPPATRTGAPAEVEP